MIATPVTGMVLLAGAWLLLTVVLCGTGHWCSLILGRRNFSPANLSDLLWLGLVGLAAGLLFWHLFLPLDWRSTVFFGALGTLGAAHGALGKNITPFRGGHSWLVTLLLSLPLCLLVANVSLSAPDLYDVGMYHLPSIRWANEYRAVPGLANLNIQHGLHSSAFLFSAFLNAYPVTEHGWRALNSFLYVTLFVESAFALTTFARTPNQIDESHLLAALYTPILVGMVGLGGLYNPTPDMTASLVGLKTYQQFIRFNGDARDSSPRLRTSMVLTVALAAVLVTVKLSTAVFAVSICLVVATSGFRSPALSRPGGRLALYAAPVICSVLILGPWLAWGTVLSGYPLFPSRNPSFSMPWRVPGKEVAVTKPYILHWNRARAATHSADPTKSHQIQKELSDAYREVMTDGPAAGEDWEKALRASRDWNWFAPWLGGVLRWPVFTGLLSLCLLGLFLLPFSVFLPGGKTAWGPKWAYGYIPVVVSFLFWLALAPSPRFALFIVAPFAAWTWTILLSRLAHSLSRPALLSFLCIVMIAFTAAQLHSSPPRLVRDVGLNGFQALPKREMRERRTDSGLKVFVPKDTMQSWNYKLPSTPFFNRRLRLLDEARGLEGGFTKLPDRRE